MLAPLSISRTIRRLPWPGRLFTRRSSPVYFLLLLVTLIAALEMGLMLAIDRTGLTPPAGLLVALLDGAFLSALLTPLIWFGIIRPMRQALIGEAESDAQFRSLIQNIQDVISVANFEGTMTYNSPSMKTVLGHEPEALVGRSCFEFIHPADQPVVRAALARVIADPSRTQSAEYRFRHADGSWRYCESIGRVMPGGENLVAVTTRDVTQRKADEARLRVLVGAVEAAANGVIITDPRGRITWTNPAFTRLTGYEAQEVIGQNPRVLRSGRHDRDFYRRMWDTITTGNVWHGEIINRRRSGELYTEEMTITPIRDPEGRITNFIAIKQDITARKEVERQLVASEARFRALAEHAPVGIYMFDAQQNCQYINNRLTQVTGLTMEHIRAGRWLAQVHPDDHERVDRGRAALFERGEGFRCEYRLVRSDGHEVWLYSRAEPLRADTGQMLGVIGTVADLTEIKRAAELQRQQASLEHALKAMEQVLGVVGHELRTPLASIRAISELIGGADPITEPDRSTLIRSIHDESVRMAEMVNNMLEVARLNSGCARWNWTSLRLSQVCDSALTTTSPLVDRGRVELDFSVEPPDLDMNGDTDAVRRLLVNLITNAIKHTGEGSIRVRVRGLSDEKGRWAELRVSDTGKGIPEAMVKKLGKAFVLNAGCVGDDYVGGSGLGLAICKGIVAVHGGSFRVHSMVGQGTTFTALLRADLPAPVQDHSEIDITQEVH